MANLTKQKLLETVRELVERIRDAKHAERHGDQEFGVEARRVYILHTYRHLFSMLGPHAQVWTRDLDELDWQNWEGMLGKLWSLEDAIENDLLQGVAGLIFAEAFADLLEQADHLLLNNFITAAGVLGRAVLEEHLRKLCDVKQCMSQKQKPTMSDYYDSLYKSQHINKIELMQIQALTAIGNDAAHAKPVRKEDVERLLRELRLFLQYHPLS